MITNKKSGNGKMMKKMVDIYLDFMLIIMILSFISGLIFIFVKDSFIFVLALFLGFSELVFIPVSIIFVIYIFRNKRYKKFVILSFGYIFYVIISIILAIILTSNNIDLYDFSQSLAVWIFIFSHILGILQILLALYFKKMSNKMTFFIKGAKNEKNI